MIDFQLFEWRYFQEPRFTSKLKLDIDSVIYKELSQNHVKHYSYINGDYLLSHQKTIYSFIKKNSEDALEINHELTYLGMKTING